MGEWTQAHEAAYRRACGLDPTPEKPDRPETVLAAKARFSKSGMGSKARMALAQRLKEAGVDTDLVAIHVWSREQMGAAYLWTIARLNGEEVPPPLFLPWPTRPPAR